jgi:hypothetical protein
MYHHDTAKPGRMNTRRGGFLDQIDCFDAQFLHGIVRAHLQAWEKRQPSSYFGEVLLFLASENEVFSHYCNAVLAQARHQRTGGQ